MLALVQWIQSLLLLPQLRQISNLYVSSTLVKKSLSFLFIILFQLIYLKFECNLA
jgi:hypothetical protein